MQLPPPIHGASLMNQRVLEIVSNDAMFSVNLLKLNYAYDFKSMHDPAYKKVLYTIKIYFSFIGNLIFKRPDFVYISFAPFGLGFYRDCILSMVSRLLGCGVKLHLHGTGLSATDSRIKAWLLKNLFSSCDLILLSESLYQDVSRFVRPDRITYISNAVETPVISENKLNETIEFLFVANLDERKGVLKAVEVFSEFTKSHEHSVLNIVGADTVSLSKADLQKKIDAEFSCVSKKINILGSLYGKDKDDIFKSSDIFIYPTMHDAAPLVVLEALSYGLPVVCSNQGALNDMVTNGDNGFVIDEYRVSSYSKSISEICTSYDQFSKCAVDTHLERDSISALSKNIKDLFCV
jgi:glycosyltransferase involved in cell wall biosynthesis